MTIKQLAKHHLECLSLKEDCTGSSESTHVKRPHCWKSHVLAYISDISGMAMERTTVVSSTADSKLILSSAT